MKIILITLILFNFLITKTELILFTKYPRLKKKISYISFCDLPTPIFKLKNFGDFLGSASIYIKRDDLTGKLKNEFLLYGGNKPRKLEFLLADAKQKNAKKIITYGCVGSNHAVATAVYAKEFGFECLLMLLDQPNSHVVRHNLLFDLFNEAQLQYFQDIHAREHELKRILRNEPNSYFIPTGGSNEIGALGFVSAAFELADQIKNGQMNEPDFIYVATGSCGTVAGLLLGIKSAGLKTKIISVPVFPEEEHDQFLENIKKLYLQTNKLLNQADSSFEIRQFDNNDLILNKKYCGSEYGLFTQDIIETIKIFNDKENIKLEGTYSARPVAAIIDDFKNNKDLKNKTILFWNTFCAVDYSDLIKYDDYKKLSKEFHKYFEQEVQELDKI